MARFVIKHRHYSAEHTYRQSFFVVPHRVQEPTRNDMFRRFVIPVLLWQRRATVLTKLLIIWGVGFLHAWSGIHEFISLDRYKFRSNSRVDHLSALSLDPNLGEDLLSGINTVPLGPDTGLFTVRLCLISWQEAKTISPAARLSSITGAKEWRISWTI